MADLHVLRVFCSPEGEWGNPLGVFLAGQAIPATERQRIAAELGFSETVFVDDASTGSLQIFTPAVELPFAGHPLVGTAWLLRERGSAPSRLQPPAGEVAVHFEGEDAYVTGEPAWTPAFELAQLGSAEEVDDLEGAPSGGDMVYAWAWIDEAAGTIRARSFVPGLGIPEDEATGAAALRLCASLSRAVTIRQGRGSILRARPVGDGRAEVGGRAVLEVRRDLPL